MGIRTEFDITTGEVRQVNATAYMVDGAIVLIDDGQPVPPGAVLASTVPMPDVVQQPPQITEAQAAKLIAFLKANPDIVEAAQL